jgi:hypothetical protein
MEIGEPEAAIRNMAQALDRNPMPPAYLPAFYATALWAGRRFDEAIRVTDDCLVRAPGAAPRPAHRGHLARLRHAAAGGAAVDAADEPRLAEAR